MHSGINRSITANADDTSACPKRQAVFLLLILWEMESRIMRKIFADHGYESLLPSGEAPLDADRKNEIE